MIDSRQFNPDLNPKENFLFFLEKYHKDKDFSIPQEIREIYYQYGDESLFVLLGRSFFSWQFILAAKDKYKNLLVVDDYFYNKGNQMLGVDIISFEKLSIIARDKKNVIAINCCPNGGTKQYFNRSCYFQDIPVIDHDQATRLLSLNSGLDYRVEDWGEYICKNKDDLLVLSERFNDEESRNTFFNVLNYHLTNNSEFLLKTARVGQGLYFYSGFFNFSDDEKFIDCGAADGDTTKTFLDVTQCKISRAWMVEPAPVHQEALSSFIRSLQGTQLEGKITSHRCAVGDSESIVSFHQDGNGSKISENENNLKVEIKKLDDFIDDVPTFVKMDIEGYELPALKGARKIIENASPKMAISAYHRSSDFLEITNYVLSINPAYKVGMRHHSKDRWETCLYFYN